MTTENGHEATINGMPYVSAQALLDAIEIERTRHMHSREGANGERLNDPEATRRCTACHAVNAALDTIARPLKAALDRRPMAAATHSCEVCEP